MADPRPSSAAAAGRHLFTRNPLRPPYPAQLRTAEFALGCFWGAEQRFWQLPGVWTTAAGYAAGSAPEPSYEEVCAGQTGHAEAVRVVYDPGRLDYAQLLACFWEGHDPTQGMRQGNDVGTQYRSGIYFASGDQEAAAGASRDAFQGALSRAGYGRITTEIRAAPELYYAEDYHQQYLAKVPWGYCGIGGIGVALPAAVERV